MRSIMIGIFCACLMINVSGKELGGLILSGVDSITTPKQCGFDFVTQTSCTTCIYNGVYNCVDHIAIGFDTSSYTLYSGPLTSVAYLIGLGKMNLDSIKSAPADSIFVNQQNRKGVDTPNDSLSSRIGNVYLIRTGPDPRPAWSGIYYAKIKILKFVTINNNLRQARMVFLWACQLSQGRDLATAGLDTFHLDGTTLNQPSSRLANSLNRASLGQYVFKVAGDRFVLPQELGGKVKSLTVWDLRGKRVATIQMSMVGNQFSMSNATRTTGNGNSIVEMPKELKGKGIFVVKGE